MNVTGVLSIAAFILALFSAGFTIWRYCLAEKEFELQLQTKQTAYDNMFQRAGISMAELQTTMNTQSEELWRAHKFIRENGYLSEYNKFVDKQELEAAKRKANAFSPVLIRSGATYVDTSGSILRNRGDEINIGVEDWGMHEIANGKRGTT